MSDHDDLVHALLVERFRPPPPRPGRLAQTPDQLGTAATRRLTEDELRHLPPVIDVPTAAAVLGISRSAAYQLIRAGQWPTPTLRLGRLIRIPTAPLLDLLKTGS